MGIVRGIARLLIEEARRRPFSGSLLQLGRNTIHFTRSELERWARWHRFELAPGVETHLSHNPALAAQGCIDDRTFYRLLGFSRVESCDISAWEGADHILDLNLTLPDALTGTYDVVLDPGTIVQVFDLPRVLANVHKALRVGGRAVHAGVPSNNHLDLGFYMASPTLFADYYETNGWSLETQYLCEYYPYWHRGRMRSAPWRVYAYREGCLDHLSFGRIGGKQLAIFTVATRRDGATGGRVPQLGQYRARWEAFAASSEDPGMPAGELRNPHASRRQGSLLRRFAVSQLERHAWMDALYLPLKRGKTFLVRKGLGRRMPPLVARF